MRPGSLSHIVNLSVNSKDLSPRNCSLIEVWWKKSTLLVILWENINVPNGLLWNNWSFLFVLGETQGVESHYKHYIEAIWIAIELCCCVTLLLFGDFVIYFCGPMKEEHWFDWVLNLKRSVGCTFLFSTCKDTGMIQLLSAHHCSLEEFPAQKQAVMNEGERWFWNSTGGHLKCHTFL